MTDANAIRLPSCSFCKRFNIPVRSPSGPAPLTCEAFPDGIPDPILRAEISHAEPYPGDGGKTFVPLYPGAKPIDPNGYPSGAI
jgi:hypothetical protein